MLNEVKCLVGTENGRQLRGVGRDDADVVETSVNVVLRRRIRVVWYEIGWSRRVWRWQVTIGVCIELTHPLVLVISEVRVVEVCRNSCRGRPIGRSCPWEADRDRGVSRGDGGLEHSGWYLEYVTRVVFNCPVCWYIEQPWAGFQWPPQPIVDIIRIPWKVAIQNKSLGWIIYTDDLRWFKTTSVVDDLTSIIGCSQWKPRD